MKCLITVLPRLSPPLVRLGCLLGFLVLVFNCPAAIRITEFLAANDGALRDEDGESPDWIEIHNSGPDPVNLGGWHLTDNAGDLMQWTFPATNLPVGGHLVVFASGKNRTVTGNPLHTNFQLTEDGEYLALVGPDGTTVVHEYAPVFPPQRANVSFGALTETFITPLISTGANVRVWVPANGVLGATWTLTAFDDDSWLATNTPVGFSAGILTVLALDINERGQSAATTTMPGFSSFVINSNANNTILTAATTHTFGGLTVTVSNTPGFGYDDRLRDTPLNNGGFTDSLLLRDFIFSRDDSNTGGLDVNITGLDADGQYRFTIWSFDSGSLNTRVSDWFVNGVQHFSNYSFSGGNLPSNNDQYRFGFDAAADGSGRVLLSGRRDLASTTFGVFLNALRIESLSAPPPADGVAALMLSNNATAFIRVPFTVADPGVFETLRLRLRYNDGFVAYLNGQLVAARNAPGSPQWNSTATAARTPAETLETEEIILVNTPGLLAAGDNVLAIHGLNVSADDPTFLVQPELDGVNSGATAFRYFAPPTPGSDNGPGYLGLVADTVFSVSRGFHNAPFTVEIATPTVGASVYWTTNGSIPSPANGTLYSAPLNVVGTTLLRAAAFLDQHVPSVPVTHSYLFLGQVLQQPANPPGYPSVWQAQYPADYEMDPNVVNSPQYGPTLSNDLRSIPTLSIVSTHDAFWHPSSGIYVDATRDGLAWERAASVELFNGDNTSQFQVNCAVQMQGNASRDNNRLAKHSFRLQFKADYGPSKLTHPWFPGPVAEFDNIVLRACFTDAWGTRYSDQTAIPGGVGTRYRPEDSLYLRDVWVKDSMRDLGHLSGRGEFVHLYVNGFYWGLYNPTERLDASYFSRHLGGYENDWDVMRDFNELLDGSRTGWDQMMAQVNAGITNELSYQLVAERVDLDNLIDYMLLHILGESEDWPSHNWYAARRRANPTNGLPATKWIFLPWDQEVVLDQLVTRNRVNVNNDGTPGRIYSQLRNWPEFRRQFGDRAHRHLFNGGALVASNNIARMQALAARVDRAIVGESARWGDAREFTIGVNPGHGQTFTRDEWWLPELHGLYTNFLPNLNALILTRLRNGNLYPAIAAPEFNQFGGAIPAGFELVMTHTNASGTIYFTLNGDDPRVYGSGQVAAAAQAYELPVAINSPTWVRARVRQAGGQWSALVEGIFTPPQDLGTLALTELMYNPPALGGISGSDLEFLELKNIGTNTLDLSGLTFSGITFTFSNATFLAPDAYFVLVRDPAAFATKYPGVTIHGVYSGQLDNAGEMIRLAPPIGGAVFALTYDEQPPWPVTADGHGFSLVPKQPGQTQASDRGERWRASALPGGSPGADDVEPAIPAVVINEVLAHTDPPDFDAVELFNPTAGDVDLSGWYLSDDFVVPKKFRIPDGTMLPAGGYLYFDEADFNTGAEGSFAFSSTGDEVGLFSATSAGELTGYSHGFVFGASYNGISFGRQVNSVGDEQLPVQLTVTLDATNAGPRIGPIVINEIHYHPIDALDGEFVELLNISDENVSLFDPAHATNTWRFNGIGYVFPTNVLMAPGELLLLTAIEPEVFRQNYQLPVGVQILGPYAGRLDNSGERLTLEAPDRPNLDAVPYVAVEVVRYNDRLPWPPAADGGGLSLQRLLASAYGDDPINWTAAGPTPGQISELDDSDADGLPDGWEIEFGTQPFVPDAGEDPDGDGSTNREEFLAGTNPTDAASTLKLESLTVDTGKAMLQFFAASNRSYSVLHKESLETGDWLKLMDLPAYPTNRIVGITNILSGEATQFYRLITPAQP